MPRTVTVTFEDGSQHIYQGVADNVSPSAVVAKAAQDFGKSVSKVDGGGKVGELPLKHSQPVASLMRGLRDPVDALAQVTVRGANAIAPGLIDQSQVDSVESANKSGMDAYRASYDGQPPSLDPFRLGGTMLAGGPLTKGLAGGATVGARALQAAGAGAIGGFATPVENPTSNMDFAGKKALQVGVGTVAAPVFQYGVDKGLNALSSLVQKAADKGAGLAASGGANAQKIVEDALKANGVDFSTLSDGVKQSLMADVKAALGKYGGVNAGALARQADFGELGITPLKPWVTRDPLDWGAYKNAEGTQFGGPLQQARADLGKKLLEKVGGLRDSVAAGANTGDSFASGKAAQAGLKKYLDNAEGMVGKLYDRFRQTAPNYSGSPARFAETVNDELDAAAAQRSLPESLRGVLNDIAEGKTPPTPQVLFQFQKLATAAQRQGGDSGYAAGILKNAITKELDQMGADFGPEMAGAANALKAARTAHRTLMTQKEAIPALEAVSAGKFDPEDFFTKYVKGAGVKDVATLWGTVDDPQIKNAVRSQMIDYLKSSAIGRGSSDEAGVFSQARFRDALADPGMKQKLQIILGIKGVEDVERIARAAEAAIKIPEGTRWNTSGTGGMVADLIQAAGNKVPLPFVGNIVRGAVSMGREASQNQADRALVGGLLSTGPDSIGQSVLGSGFNDDMRRRIAMLSGLLGYSGGAALGANVGN